VRVKSDVPKYSVFLHNRHLVFDVSRKETVALAKNKNFAKSIAGFVTCLHEKN